jgi:hypothetical protein
MIIVSIRYCCVSLQEKDSRGVVHNDDDSDLGSFPSGVVLCVPWSSMCHFCVRGFVLVFVLSWTSVFRIEAMSPPEIAVGFTKNGR